MGQKIARTGAGRSLSILLVVLVWVYHGQEATGQEESDRDRVEVPKHHTLTEQDLKEIVEFIERTRVCHGVAALTATIVQNDKVLLAQAFGEADVEKGEKATSQTPFCIGSLTKGFTSTLLGIQLANEESSNINWDTPLHCFPKSDIAFSDEIRSSQANLRDVLSHKLGVPSYFSPLLVGYPAQSTRKQLAQRVRFMEPMSPFRSHFFYNNYMYAVAGYTGELLADGKSWEKLIQEKIFEPAGMTSSGFIDETGRPAGLAQPYVYVNDTLYKVDTEVARTVHPLGPAGSIYSTAEDMAKWIQLHLAVISRTDAIAGPPVTFPGTLTLSGREVERVWETYEGQMVEPSLAEALTRPRYPIDDIELSYAMGWMRAIYRGYLKLYHTGGISSYTSLLQLLPDVRAGMFFSSSGPGGSQSVLTKRIISAFISDKLLGEAPWLNLTTACTFPAPWKTVKARRSREKGGQHPPPILLGSPIPTPSSGASYPLATFTGTYGHLGFGRMEFDEEEGRLYLRYGRLGRAVLEKSSVEGFFYCSFLDKLWYLSHRDEGSMIWRLQFVDLVDGKTQTLLAHMDPIIVTRFERDLDVDNIPPHHRQHPDLYVCPNSQNYSNSGPAPPTHYITYSLISLLLLYQHIYSLW